MAQPLRAPVILKNLALVPSIHMGAHNYLYLQFQETQHRLLASLVTRHACGARACTHTYTHIYTRKIPTHSKNNNKMRVFPEHAKIKPVQI